MGVKDLWSILAPVRKEVPLTDLIGKTIAVDLSVWICENNGVKAVQGRVCKPHLRALFFRVSNLLQMGVNLVFVVDGEPPELKWETISSRVNARFGGRGRRGGGNPKQRTSRSHFKSLIKECLELLDYLGVPYVQSKGEAEAMCALLNQRGIVDACITEDGDVFLYGGQMVYRNFNLMGKNPVIECYSMKDITEQLGMSRNTLVALALLLGCDYVPKGVPGVGKVHAVQLVQRLAGRDILKRFQSWAKETSKDSLPMKPAHCSRCHHVGSAQLHRSTGCPQCIGTTTCSSGKDLPPCTCTWHSAKKEYDICSVERDIRVKAMKIPNFPQLDVISEFLDVKDECPEKRLTKSSPEMVKLMRFAHDKLEWTHVYTREKVVQLVTLYNLERSSHGEVRLDHIVKRRVRNGVACLEVAWKLPASWQLEDDESTTISTIEKMDLFKSVHPEIFAEFECQENSKKGKKKGNTKKKQIKDVEAEESLEAVTDQLMKVALRGEVTADQRDPEGPSFSCRPVDAANTSMNEDFESVKCHLEESDSDANCVREVEDDSSIQSTMSKNFNEMAVFSDETPTENVFTCNDHLDIPSLRERLLSRTKHTLQRDSQSHMSSSAGGLFPAARSVTGGLARDGANSECYGGPVEPDPSHDKSNKTGGNSPDGFESSHRAESLEHPVVSENFSNSASEFSTLGGNAHGGPLNGGNKSFCNLRGFETVTEPQDIPTPDVSLINNVSTDGSQGKSFQGSNPSLDKGEVTAAFRNEWDSSKQTDANSLLKCSRSPESASFCHSPHQTSNLVEPTEVYDLCTPDVTLELDKSQNQQFDDIIVVISDDEDEPSSRHQTSTDHEMVVPKKQEHAALDESGNNPEVTMIHGTVHSQLNGSQTVASSLPRDETMKKACSVCDHDSDQMERKMEAVPSRVTTPECSMWHEPTLLDVSTPFQRRAVESPSTFSQTGSTESYLMAGSSSYDANSACDSIQSPCLVKDYSNRFIMCGTPSSGITARQGSNRLKHSDASSLSLDYATPKSDCEADRSRDHSLFQGLNFSLKTSPWNAWTPPLIKSRHEMRCGCSALKESDGPTMATKEMRTSQEGSKTVPRANESHLLQAMVSPKAQTDQSRKGANFHWSDSDERVIYNHSKTGDSRPDRMDPSQNGPRTNPGRFQNHGLHCHGKERVEDCQKAELSQRYGCEGMMGKEQSCDECSLDSGCVTDFVKTAKSASNMDTKQDSEQHVEELFCGQPVVSVESKEDVLDVSREPLREGAFKMQGTGMSSVRTENCRKEGLSCCDKSNVIGQRSFPTISSTTGDHSWGNQRPLVDQGLPLQSSDVHTKIHTQRKVLSSEEKENSSPASLMDRLRMRNLRHRDILKSMELD